MNLLAKFNKKILIVLTIGTVCIVPISASPNMYGIPPGIGGPSTGGCGEGESEQSSSPSDPKPNTPPQEPTIISVPPSKLGIPLNPEGTVGPTFHGGNDVTVPAWEPFDVYKGMTATDRYGKDVTDSIQVIAGYLDTSAVGDYELVFRATDSEGLSTLHRRKILVVDEHPPFSIATINGIPDTELYVGEYFNALNGVSAYDRYDGDLTDDIVVMNYIQSEKEGIFVVQYSVRNHRGVQTIRHRLITVEGKKPTPPIITGLTDMYVGRGSQYSLFHGVHAYDYTGKDISRKVNVDKYVDPRDVGVHWLTYDVTDDYGFITYATRKLTIY